LIDPSRAASFDEMTRMCFRKELGYYNSVLFKNLKMKKSFILLLCVAAFFQMVSAQENEEVKKGFKKENLFTGGSLSFSFFNNSFLIGGSPVFGYSLTKWADVGLVANYNYTSYRDYSGYGVDDKLRQSVYGGGLFTRLFPVRFIFAQAQVEHNQSRLKYIPPPNSGMSAETNHVSANSVLIGGGYTTGRDGEEKRMYGYVAVLFDVSKSVNSPYTDNFNRSLPIIRAGIHIPLFQKRRED
jgi:hypothetical protein